MPRIAASSYESHDSTAPLLAVVSTGLRRSKASRDLATMLDTTLALALRSPRGSSIEASLSRRPRPHPSTVSTLPLSLDAASSAAFVSSS